MKKLNEKTSKKSLVVAMVIALVVTVFAGCGNATVDKSNDSQDIEKEVSAEAVSNEETASEEDSFKEEGVTPPFLTDLEIYDSILSTLTKDQYYAFAGISKDYDVLLVTDYVYDNLDGNMATINATVYGLDQERNVIVLGNVSSDGTACPLAVYDDCLMFGGHHYMNMVFVEDGSLITKKYADAIYDEDGNETYSYFDYDEKFEGQVDDDSKLNELYDIYNKAIVINFTQAE